MSTFYNKSNKTTPIQTTKKVTNKPYCKVCHDSGKSEAEYTSHYVKSEPGPNGVVVCPTLLNQECRFCGKTGHTVSRCPEIANINKQQECIQKEQQKKYKTREYEENNKQNKSYEKRTNNNSNKFAIFENDPDVFVTKKVKNVKKVLPIQKVLPESLEPIAPVKTWASMVLQKPDAIKRQTTAPIGKIVPLSNTMIPKVMTPRSPESSPPPLRGSSTNVMGSMNVMGSTKQAPQSVSIKLPDIPRPTRIPMRNWAEYESSDDETDYEEYDDNHDW